jgi:hypothetical protein
MTVARSRARDVAALAFLYAQIIAAVATVPGSPGAHWYEPGFLTAWGPVITLAVWGDLFTAVALTAIWVRGRAGARAERKILASFLASMPFVYLFNWAREPAAGWLPVELLGAAVFIGLALLGLKRSVWFLAAGIAAHGVLWDLWHHGRTPFMPDWYALACLISDVGLGAYVAIHLTRFEPRPGAAPRLA